MTITSPPRFRTVQPRRTRVGGAQAAHASDYTALAKEIKASGLLDRRPIWYAIRCTALGILFALGFVLMLTLGHTWWELAVAGYFGLLFTQASFLAHDSAHRQVFESGKRNEWFSRIVANLVVGLSYGWWMTKHSKHHANPNTIGKDGDLATNAIVFTPEAAATRTGFARWAMARQGYFFFPVMTLTGLDLYKNAIKTVAGRDPMKHRAVEATFIAVRLIGFSTLVILTLGPAIGIAFLAVQTLVFGFTMGGSFAPNHKGMPLIAEGQTVDYLRRQVLTSRNITGGWPVAVGMGGLNFQIEHHLFPNMPSINLRRARPIVRAYCARLDVPYTETTLLRSYAIVVQYIHRVGIRSADPFDCPAAAAFRTA